MKRVALFLALLLSMVPAMAQVSYDNYIRQYSSIAVSEMRRCGVPASITLAQGLLESAAGSSVLARMGNNHFGIKCAGTWTGQKIYHDDDAKGECFRKYSNVRDSFRDHSDFLRYSKRYQPLFDLEVTDYKGWAYGLKAAGYATDESYARKLIELIERYSLNEFDKEVAASSKETSPGKTPSGKTPEPVLRPESPTVLQEAHRSSFVFQLSRPVYEVNGVPFIQAMEGETIESIANDFNLFRKELMRFNDLASETVLLPGQRVYLKSKSKKAVRGLEKHVVETDDETLWEISQHYAIRMKALRKMNASLSQVEGNAALRQGTILNLR